MIKQVLFWKEIRENRIKFYIASALFGILAVVIPLLFPWVKSFLRHNLFGLIPPGELNFIVSNYDNYIWSQWMGKNLFQLGILFAVILGMGPLAGEVFYGTAPFLLSKPLTRRQVYFSKALAGLSLLAAAFLGSSLLLYVVSSLKGYALHAAPFAISILIVYLGTAVVYSGTLIFSSLVNEPVKAALYAFVFWFALSIPGYFAAAAPYSFFYHMKGIPYWFKGENPLFPALIFLAVAWVLLEAGLFLWKRKDF